MDETSYECVLQEHNIQVQLNNSISNKDIASGEQINCKNIL